MTIDSVKEVLEYSSDNYMQTIHVSEGIKKDEVTSALFLFDSKTRTITIHDYLGKSKILFKI
ncbi:hypothetical protein FWC31_01380 [Candidatus Saccharibacteria bacterium]|nr:hypothetical protein [Candidatus Saccharibacteria bacterium]